MLEGGEGREGGEVPQDRRDAHIVILYKNNEVRRDSVQQLPRHVIPQHNNNNNNNNNNNHNNKL